MNLRSPALLLSTLPVLTLTGVAQQDGILRPVPLPEATALRARLDRTLLPTHISHLEVEPRQVFRLVVSGQAAPGQTDLLLVPVTFWNEDFRSRCGLYVLPADTTPQSFVFTLTGNEDLAVSQCGNLIAVRRTPHDGPHPHLRLTYRTFDPPRFEDTADIILEWDPKAATYKVAASPRTSPLKLVP